MEVSLKVESFVRSGSKLSYKRPTEIGCYSLNDKKEYVPDRSEMKYLYKPEKLDKVYFDLNVGYKNVVKKRTLQLFEGNDGFYRWIFDNRKAFKHANPDFVCYRGTIAKVMNTPFENYEDWIVGATKYKGKWYLCNYITEKKRLWEENSTSHVQKMISWGFKFEQYLTTDIPGKMPDTSVPLNEIREFNIVITSKLNGHGLVFAAEVDAVDLSDDVSLNPPHTCSKTNKYIEIKTYKTGLKDYKIRAKLKKWWTQSFLVGVEDIYCGLRDDKGIASSVVKYKISDIPEYLKLQNEKWSAPVCINFGDQFLSFVKKTAEEDNPNCVYRYAWKAGDKTVTFSKHINDETLQILPDWFIKEF